MRVDANVSVRRPRHRGVRHSLRDQEPQLGPLARSGHRVRGPPPDRPPRGGRARPPGDPPLGRGRRPHPHAAGEGGRRRLPLLPRARPRAARSPTPSGSAGSGRACRCCRRGRRRPPGRRRRRRPADDRPWPSPSSAASTTSPSRRSTPVAIRAGCSCTSSTTWPSTGPSACSRSALAALTRLEVDGQLTATQAKAVLAELVAAGGDGDPAAIAAAKGFEAMDAGDAGGGRRRRPSPPTRGRVDKLRRRRGQGGSAPSSVRS